jgi:hypothetical protein
MEVTLQHSLQCLVVEIELRAPGHDCGPDCPCWDSQAELTFGTTSADAGNRSAAVH